jgi:hypothetical protein
MLQQKVVGSPAMLTLDSPADLSALLDPDILISKQNRLRSARLAAAKRAFTTRRVDFGDARQLVMDRAPISGDLLLARIDAVGHHPRIESPEGRRRALYVGDEIVVAYGARYAPDQFEAIVPNDLGPCHLVAGGGVAASVLSRNGRVGQATRITPIGLLGNQSGKVMNLSNYALSPVSTDRRPVVMVVAGTSMNAGKTTTATGLIRGLAQAGLNVGGGKVTGTGSGGDFWSMMDAGAQMVLDFTDMGHASTAGLDLDVIENTALGVIDQLAATETDVIVIEIADGILQRETRSLLQSADFRDRVDGVLFASGDALGASGGVAWLQSQGLKVAGISGLVSISPLASREAECASGLTVYGLDALNDPITAPKICFGTGFAECAAR